MPPMPTLRSSPASRLSPSPACGTLTLQFADEELEKAYVTHYYSSTHDLLDKPFAIFNAIGSAVHLTLQVGGLVKVSNEAASYTLAYLLIALFHHVCLMRTQYSPSRHRTYLIVCFRGLYVAICLAAMPVWVPADPHPDTISAVAKHVLLGSGALLGAWFHLGLPILFRQAVILGLLESLAASACLAASVCQHITMVPEGQQAILSLWMSLNSAATMVYEAHLPGSSHHNKPRSGSPCLSVATFTQYLMGLAIPLAIIYKLEWRSREAYCVQHHEAGTVDVDGTAAGGGGGEGVVPVHAAAAWPRHLVQLLCLLLGLAGAWELFNMLGSLHVGSVSGSL